MPSRLLAVLLLLAPACSRDGEDACPGEPVGRFLLEVSVPEEAVPSACAAEPPVTDPPTRIVARFEARLHAEPSAAEGASAALCPGGRAATYFGTRAADGTYALDARSGHAVLDRCGASCSVAATAHVRGAVAGEGDAATFAGTLEERFEYLAGDCGDCVLPCAAAYALTSTLPAPAVVP